MTCAELGGRSGEPCTVRILRYFPIQASVSVRRGQTDTLAGQEYLNHSVLKRSRAQVKGNRVFAEFYQKSYRVNPSLNTPSSRASPTMLPQAFILSTACRRSSLLYR